MNLTIDIEKLASGLYSTKIDSINSACGLAHKDKEVVIKESIKLLEKVIRRELENV